MQTTFLYAHRALERGVKPELEYAWLHSIAKNVCRWQLRTLSRRGSLTTVLDLDAMPGSSSSDFEVRELRGELQDALASIPETQRKALVLRELRGLESHEVAEELGMSTTATYALLTRARRSAAKALRAAGSRPVLGIDVIASFGKLKALLAGGTAAKVAATTLTVGAVAVGGVAVERAVDDAGSPARKFHAPPALPVEVPSGSVADRMRSAPDGRQRGASRNAARPKVRAPVGSAPGTGTSDSAAPGSAPGSEGSTGTETQPSGSGGTLPPAELPNPAATVPGPDVPVPTLPPVVLPLPPVDLPADDLVPPVDEIVPPAPVLPPAPALPPPPVLPPPPPLPLP